MAIPPPLCVALTDLPVGSLRACTVRGREILIVRTKRGIFALDNICTHAFARLSEGWVKGERLVCPLHGASFDLRDGRVLGGPAGEPLAVHPLQLLGDRVEISVP